MHLGVPFIAPKQLGAIESIPGRQIFPSVAWRTGQSGADFFPSLAKPTVGAFWSRWRTRHCPVHIEQSGAPSSRWLGHASRTDYAVDRWPGRPLAHRTVRCTPDSPVNYSRTPPVISRERLLHAESAWRDRKSTRLNSSHITRSRMPSSA